MTKIMEVSLLIQAVGIWMIIFIIYTGWDLEKIRAMIRKKKPEIRALLHSLRSYTRVGPLRSRKHAKPDQRKPAN